MIDFDLHFILSDQNAFCNPPTQEVRRQSLADAPRNGIDDEDGDDEDEDDESEISEVSSQSSEITRKRRRGRPGKTEEKEEPDPSEDDSEAER